MRILAIALFLSMLMGDALAERAAYATGPGILEDYVGVPSTLGIDRLAWASVSSGSTPQAGMGQTLWPCMLGKGTEAASLSARARSGSSSSASIVVELNGVVVDDLDGPQVEQAFHIRSYRSGSHLTRVGPTWVYYHANITASMDIDLVAQARAIRYIYNPWLRTGSVDKGLARVHGTVDTLVQGRISVSTRGAYAYTSLRFFDGTLRANELAANRDTLVHPNPSLNDWVAADIKIDSVWLYFRLYNRGYYSTPISAYGRAVDRILVLISREV
jgi:hypothetical protein